MKKVYTEVGFGNDSFFSTEFEENNQEYRVAKFIIPKKLNEVYFRLWIFKTNLILSTKDGIKIKIKDRNKLKILFGLGGTNL